MTPDFLFENKGWEVVQVNGPTFASHLTNERIHNTTTNETWVPVLPMVWDDDGNAVLAIVGAAFLVLLPMQIWSSTLRKAGIARILVGLWSFLLLGGLVSALIYVEFVIFSSFPQLRFCPPRASDVLPFSNKGPYTYPLKWVIGDWYRWNRVVGEQYVYRNATTRFPDICLYPCLESEWPLRDPEDIFVDERRSHRATSAQFWFLALIYFMVASSCICNLCLLLVTHTDILTNDRWGVDHALVDLIRERRFPALLKQACTKRTRTASNLQWVWRAVVDFVFWYVSLFSVVMSPVTLVAFVAVCETLLLSGSSGVETFRHVGQWGALIGAVLVVLSAVASHFLEPRARSTPEDDEAVELLAEREPSWPGHRASWSLPS